MVNLIVFSPTPVGVTFDNNTNFLHILQTCCWFCLLVTIATALVSSKLDYCNSLYHNIALRDILKLQHCLARVVTQFPRFSHSLPLIKSLHWLPVQYRIIFNICTITYQVLLSKQPAYLHSLLTPARQPRQLRSSNSNLLFVPSVKTNVFFSCCTDSVELTPC